MTNLIAIIGIQRSGTTVFRQLLRANGAHDFGEIFHADFRNNQRNFYGYLHTRLADEPGLIHPTRLNKVFRDFLAQQIGGLGKPHAVVDVKYNALRFVDAGLGNGRPATVKALADAGARFVHIIRRNKLRIIASRQIAERTGQWSQRGSETHELEDRRVVLNPDACLRNVRADLAMDNRVAQWLKGLRTETIAYEEMFEEGGEFSDRAISTVRAVMDLDIASTGQEDVDLVRQNPEGLGTLITNFDQVTERFRGTEHEWMLAG